MGVGGTGVNVGAGTGVNVDRGVAAGDSAVGAGDDDGDGDTATVAVGCCSPQPAAIVINNPRTNAIAAQRPRILGITGRILPHPAPNTARTQSASSQARYGIAQRSGNH